MDNATAPTSSLCDLQCKDITPHDALLLLAGQGSWRQYPAYSQCAAERVRARSSFIGVFRSGEAIAVANLRTKKLPLGLGASSLISHGPALIGSAEAQVQDLADALRSIGQYAKATNQEIRIDPDPVWFLNPDLAGEFARLPHKTGGSAYRTILLDLEGGPEAVRSRFKSKWRGNLRQAEKNDLRVVRSEDTESIVAITPLLENLMERKGFSIDQDPHFYATVGQKSSGPEKVISHLVYKADELLSAHIGAFSGESATYLLGATSRAGMDMRAAHLAQMKAIETACEMRQRYYDTGGIDPENNPGVYKFKKRMGGVDLSSSAPAIIAPGGIRGEIIGLTRRAYQAVKK